MKRYLLLIALGVLAWGQTNANTTNHESSAFKAAAVEKDSIYIPNAFSPNEDGRNDRFEVFVKSGTSARIKTYKIFNRWGGLVFEQENILLPASDLQWWDGYFNGERVTPDTYVYRIEVEYGASKTLVYTGEIALLR